MSALRLNPYRDVDWTAIDQHTAQFHTHTSHPPTEGHSGTDSPEQVIDDYHDAGYSVLALTGHEYNIEEPTWPWTDWDRDPDALEMVAVQAAELGGSEEGIDRDLLSLFCDLADTSGLSVHEVLETIGDRGGVALFPHPSRYNGDDGEWYVEYFQRYPHLLGIEVVNAANRYPTDRDVWDDLQERLGNERAVWGFANDDYHGQDDRYSFDRSRNVLLLEELTTESVREALVAGRFFYQHRTGDKPPDIERIEHDAEQGTLRIDAPNAELIQWASAGSVVGRGREFRYSTAEDLGSYVRARVLSESGSETGTQPFLFE